MMPLASSRISPGWSFPVAQAAWCGKRRLMRTSPGYGALESMPPDTDRPKPLGPLIISTLNVQSEMIKCRMKEAYWVRCGNNVWEWNRKLEKFPDALAHVEDNIKWVEKLSVRISDEASVAIFFRWWFFHSLSTKEAIFRTEKEKKNRRAKRD